MQSLPITDYRLPITQLLRWEMQLVHHSPIIQDLLLERHKEGFYQATLKALQKMLEFRFGVEPAVFEPRLEPLDLKAIEQLEETVFTVQSLAEFEKALDTMTVQKPQTKDF